MINIDDVKTISAIQKGPFIMSIRTDFHLHSLHSGDSHAPVEDMVLRGLSLGLTHMCFTEHNDFDFPLTEEEPENIFLLDTGNYLQDFLIQQKRYGNHIRLLFGVELGLQPVSAAKNADLARSRDFDFIIGSSHLCDGKDPYYPAFYQGRSEEEAYREYFSSILQNLECFTDFDVYGHLDYVVRYGPEKDRNYSYEKYKDLFDKILLTLIDAGKGIEINTGGVEKGLRQLHPCTDVVRRYRELGGDIITVGSDAHEPARITASFPRAEEVLRECGFRYYTIFEHRKPSWVKL